MKKAVIAMLFGALLLLAACESKTTGKRVAIPEKNTPTAAVVASTPKEAAPATVPTTSTPTPTKTAAELLKEYQQSGALVTAGPKVGNFYPPVTTSATGKDALKEKTHALLSQSGYAPNVTADTDFGSRYYSSDGDPKNLPSNYRSSSIGND